MVRRFMVPFVAATLALSGCQAGSVITQSTASMDGSPRLQEASLFEAKTMFELKSSHSDRAEKNQRSDKNALSIQDVVLAESGQSVMGASAPASLPFAPEGRVVRLLIKGKFKADQSFKAKNLRFPFTGWINQTFLREEPSRRVLLNDSIFLPIDAAKDNELAVLLNTKALTDLAIPKLHQLTVFDAERTASADIKVSGQSKGVSLAPVITKAEFVEKMDKAGEEEHEERSDDELKYLRVEGYNFPVTFYAHWAQLNGVRLYAHATWIKDEASPRSVVYLHLPEHFTPKPVGTNDLVYANPFGFSFSSF